MSCRSPVLVLESCLVWMGLAACSSAHPAIDAASTESAPDLRLEEDRYASSGPEEGIGSRDLTDDFVSKGDTSAQDISAQDIPTDSRSDGQGDRVEGVAVGDAWPETGAEGGGETGVFKCISDWPKGPGAPVLPPSSLDVNAPTVLWRKQIPDGKAGDGLEGGGVAVSGNRLVVMTQIGLNLMDKTGAASEASGWLPDLYDWASPPTTDAGGTIYFAAPSGTYALNPDGTRKWRQREGAIPYGEGLGVYRGKALALDPEGTLYGVSGDGQVRAFRSSDGKVLWRRAIGQLQYPQFAYQSAVIGGAGSALFVRPGSEATLVLDKRDGTEIGRLILDDGKGPPSWTTEFALGFSGMVYEGLSFFDRCGRPILSQGNTRTVSASASDSFLCGTLGLSEHYAVYLHTVDSDGFAVAKTDRLSLYDSTGNRVRGPTSGKGQPFAVGADGMQYTISCYNTNPQENRLYAYDSELNEIWHLDLGRNGWCPSSYGILDDDGVLYFPIANEQHSGDDMMAIQTRSPGLARSAWPMTRHDVRGTMWLVPLDSPAATDGGAPATGNDGGTAETGVVVDAGLDLSISR